MAEEYQRAPAVEPKKSSGMLKFILLIIIILALLWYFAPDVLQNLISFIQSKLS